MKGPPPDKWSRSKSLVSAVAGVAREELGHRLRASFASTAEKLAASELRTRIEQAKLLAESLGRLKGALMKAGQLLSMDSSDWLPPEAAELLAKLQREAEPVDFGLLRQVLVEDLGESGLAALEQLEEAPAASASIGQVHRARAFGESVAVKIQYPGVRESIDSDLQLLEKLGSGFLSISGRDIDLGGVFEELSSVLHFETDYVRERVSMDRFAELLAGDSRFVVPRSMAPLSSSRVLTMSWEDGVALGDWVRSSPPREDRALVAGALLDLYCLEFFRWGVVQTDPNFGNFLLRPSTKQMVLLDFGATMEFDDAFRTGYVELLRVVESRDPDAIAKQGMAFGLIDPRESREAGHLFAEMLCTAVEPFDASKQPFDFSNADYAARSRDVARRFTKSLAHSPPPRKLLFLHRKLGGLFHLLRKLNVELDLVPYWEEMVAGRGTEAS